MNLTYSQLIRGNRNFRNLLWGQFISELGSWFNFIASAPTVSIGRIKRMMNASFANGLYQQLSLEHECQIESGKANDFKKGVHAFFEKRAPNFTGT